MHLAPPKFLTTFGTSLNRDVGGTYNGPKFDNEVAYNLQLSSPDGNVHVAAEVPAFGDGIIGARYTAPHLTITGPLEKTLNGYLGTFYGETVEQDLNLNNAGHSALLIGQAEPGLADNIIRFTEQVTPAGIEVISEKHTARRTTHLWLSHLYAPSETRENGWDVTIKSPLETLFVGTYAPATAKIILPQPPDVSTQNVRFT